MDGFTLAQLEEIGQQIQATKGIFLASLVVLLYDHALTLRKEIRHFWGQPLTITSALFYFNRYYTIISFSFISFLFMSPKAINPKICQPASAFLPLGGTLPISLASSLLLTTRVYAIYNRNKYLLAFLLTYQAASTGVSIWLYGIAGHLPLALPSIPLDAFRICIDQTPPSIPQNTTITWIIMQCSFDLIILLLTIFRSLKMVFRRNFSGRNLYKIILQDGLLYFFCIFSSNFAWAMMVLTAEPGVKYLIAIPNLAICATAVSRISINLRDRAFSESNAVVIIGYNGGGANSQRISNFPLPSSLPLFHRPSTKAIATTTTVTISTTAADMAIDEDIDLDGAVHDVSITGAYSLDPSIVAFNKMQQRHAATSLRSGRGGTEEGEYEMRTMRDDADVDDHGLNSDEGPVAR